MDKFDTTCRTCNAIRSNLVNLDSYLAGKDNLKLLDILCSVCPSLSIQDNDKLPQQICFFCSKQLEIAYKFQAQCLKSNEEQLKLVEHTNAKEQPLQQQLLEDDKISENEPLETNNEMSSAEEDFEDMVAMTESPEFLEEEEADAEIEVLPEKHSVVENDSVKASFDCKLCDKNYLTSNGLLLHMKLSHKNAESTIHKIEVFECNYCNQVFENRAEQREHSRLEHINELKRNVSCNICQKTFIGKNKLDHHLLYHGKDQYQCFVKDCKRTFVIKYKLTDHLKRYHGIVPSVGQLKALRPTTRDT